MTAPVPDRDHELLLAGSHHDPHSYLGAHPGAQGVVLRVFRPDAAAVRAMGADGVAHELEPAGEGLFTTVLTGVRAAPRLGLELDFPDGSSWRTHDPYRLAPSIGELDLHLVGEGTHRRLWDALGARPGTLDGAQGTAFTVWAPSARAVSVIGHWNGWDARIHPMRSMGGGGVWELFLPGVDPGARYKFAIRAADGRLLEKADPMARECEAPPATASIVAAPATHEWTDGAHMARVRAGRPHAEAMSVYEVHLPSWRRHGDGGRPMGYRELGAELGDYAAEMGFTHVELLPVMGHPFSGSWGYQVTSYYAPAPGGGTPDDLRALVDALHARGIGVILDWVPAHFPKDAFGLARFDGSHLYEHADPRRGEHPDWGTLVFNHGRAEVRNFLVANGLYWMEEFHVDGLRVDAVASMLYRDYSREAGEWVPNAHGGREDEEAIGFLRELNTVTHAEHPGRIVAAEESTAWPAVSRPVDAGGLGFDLKWNMGWMHDTLEYFGHDPIHRAHHHDELTFSLVYAFSEQFVLPLSHDEVVHGKGSLIARMPGDDWQSHANLRALYGYMWAHPGKKLLFMGSEFAQEAEWSHERSLDWHLLEHERKEGCRRLVADLNHRYREFPAMWQIDADPRGFRWLVSDDRAANVMAFARFADDGSPVVAVCNLSPVPREGYRMPLPLSGPWHEVLNTDAAEYGGAGLGNDGPVVAEHMPWGGEAHSATLTLPPLAVLWLVPGG
ncbi:MAG: 1,4-alpha-glucan branching protein GlgB [Miltoncostaeaceae bacterium]